MAVDTGERYFNPPTVVVGVIPLLIRERRPALLGIRRRGGDGERGRLALPGGYQEKETWQEALVREVKEETGQVIKGEYLEVGSMVTVHDGTLNLLFATHPPIILRKEEFVDDGVEVEEVLPIRDGDVSRSQDWAFPAHHHVALKWFNSPPYEKIFL